MTTPNEIRDRITMTIACSSPETLKLIPAKVAGYIQELEKKISECKICGVSMGSPSCPACMKADEVLVWIRHQVKKIEKEMGE